jgi:hypothetical protein
MAFLIVAAFLLTNKAWSPQYSLWLVPLAVLALPRWLPLLAWMSVDAYLWYPRMGYFLGSAVPGHGNSQKQFLTVVLARDLLVVIVCALIVRTIYRPDVDPVRAAGFDAPAGGPLDGAPDRPRWWFGRPGPGLTTGDQAPGDQAPGDQDLADASSPGSRHADTAPDPAPSPRSAW